jgi:hypothetical protein
MRKPISCWYGVLSIKSTMRKSTANKTDQQSVRVQSATIEGSEGALPDVDAEQRQHSGEIRSGREALVEERWRHGGTLTKSTIIIDDYSTCESRPMNESLFSSKETTFNLHLRATRPQSTRCSIHLLYTRNLWTQTRKRTIHVHTPHILWIIG